MLAALNLAYQLAERPPRASAPRRARRQRRLPDERTDIDALIRPLDAALGDDGHLL